MNESREGVVFGMNPVREAIRSAISIRRLLIARGRQASNVDAIVEAAKKRGILIEQLSRGELDRVAGTTKHQGIAVQTVRGVYHVSRSFEEVIADSDRKAGEKFLVVMDGIEDPRNLGAIARTAEAVGVGGLIMPQRRSVGVTAVALKASAGALSHLPIAQVVNLARALKTLKQSGYWIVGLDSRSSTQYTDVDYRGPVAIVVGHEGSGLRALTRESCDFLVSLPMLGRIDSLNVSVAAGVVLYEALRQRRAA